MITLIFSKEPSGTLNDASHQHWTALQQKFTSSSVCASLYIWSWYTATCILQFFTTRYSKPKWFLPRSEIHRVLESCCSLKIEWGSCNVDKRCIPCYFSSKPQNGICMRTVMSAHSLAYMVWSVPRLILFKRQGLKLDECYWSRNSTFLQGSHLDWKTCKNGKTFSNQGNVKWILNKLEKSRNFRPKLFIIV